MTWITEDLERAMRDVARESDRTDYEIVTANADTLLRSVAYNTPRRTGTARAGWWPAWTALGKAGSPGTRRAYNQWEQPKTRRKYTPDGYVVDKRRERGERSFEFVNTTHYLTPKGKRVNYIYMVDARQQFMAKAAEEATFKFERAYEKLFKRHNG